MKHKTIIISLLILFILSCKQEYIPPIEEDQQSLLVVEGNLNAGSDSTFIRLTRSQALTNSSAVKPEENALLTVEGKDNSIRSLTGTGNGYYISPDLNLVVNNEYRLRIKTANGKEYLSDYIKAKATPPIDSIGWHRNEEGVNIYVNTSDPANATRYYRWEYAETWEMRSLYPPQLIYENGTIRYRIFPQEEVSICWKNSNSTNILIANTTRLQEDIVSEQPLTFIPQSDEKLFFRYSILVKQYALDADSYAFYDLLKKNTEDIGSFFSPQPTEIKGNLHCLSNPNEQTIGYLTASSVSSKRVFISKSEVPGWPNLNFCPEITVPNNRDSINYSVNVLGLMPVYYFGMPPNSLLRFSEPRCVDCTTRGGNTTKPSYW